MKMCSDKSFNFCHFSAEVECQTGLTCSNGQCVRNPDDAVESCKCDKGYELSNSNNSLCVGKLI